MLSLYGPYHRHGPVLVALLGRSTAKILEASPRWRGEPQNCGSNMLEERGQRRKRKMEEPKIDLSRLETDD